MNHEVAQRRARHSALIRHRPADDPDVIEARRDLKAASMAERINRFKDYLDREIASAPKLTDEQRNKLAELLAPVRVRAVTRQASSRGRKSA